MRICPLQKKDWFVWLPTGRQRHGVDIHRLAAQHRADWLRGQVLTDTGGIWFDATCVLYRPVDQWLTLHTDAVIIGYAYPHSDSARILENWALFVPTASPFMAAWWTEFDRAVKMGLTSYIQSMHDIPHGLNLPYHTMHAAGWTRGRICCFECVPALL